ncbi:hypothetical protein M758_12G030500 [Ceratodon purpureus]|uniref:Uncharacterized protein n=1 Tax=Ceratodon purpureus TaxID=3225 RepID=A0A8T0G6I6_CERPU|nr:hypothetical protein KC19_12G030800 [Ceratodon purpureus]KAG0597914.1 hypothetical protein M758_12G030500 [Ceratodon purpureus]
MFHMEFQSLDAVEEDDEPSRTDRVEEGQGNSVYEQYRPNRAVESKDSPPKIYEGRVGKFGKMQRVVSSNHAVHHTVSDLPPVMGRSMSTNDSIPRNWVEVDLIDFGKSAQEAPQGSETQAPADPVVMRELVKPFAESVKINDVPSAQNRPAIVDLLSNGVPVVEAVSGSSPNAESLQVRTNSLRSSNSASFSDTSDAESNSFHDSTGERARTKDEEKGSPATRAYNRAFNKIMHKKSKPPVQDAQTVSKPWDEPLLAAHDQAKLQRKLQKEAKLEAKRLAEEAKRDAEIQQRELLELANPVPESALNNKKDHGVRKGIHKLFHIHAGTHSNQNSPREGVMADVREAKLVMPRSGLFESSMMSPSTTKDITLSQIRTGPRPTARKDITFATVESNQRDVQPWTMEEYMAKNARQAEWQGRVDDEEFGGIEGNQLLNQYFNNDLDDTLDSDSD